MNGKTVMQKQIAKNLCEIRLPIQLTDLLQWLTLLLFKGGNKKKVILFPVANLEGSVEIETR